MTHPAHTAAVEIEAETNLGEDVHTFATLRLPVTEIPDLSTLVHEKIDSGRVQQHRQGGSPWIVGTQFGSQFKTRVWLTGHGSATSGAVTLNALETLLGNIIGNATSTGTGTTFTGGTSKIPTTTSDDGLAVGGLIRAGALKDGHANGQWAVVDSHATNNLTLLTELPGAPVDGNVLHSAVNIYPSESPTNTTVKSYRMRVLTANLRYELHGCVPVAIAFSPLSTGDKPYIDITWAVAWWETINTGTFPSTLATWDKNPAPIAAGSFFFNTVDTEDRATIVPRSFTVEYTLGVELFKGPGGFSPYQEVVAARRTRDTIKVSLVGDADANTATPVFQALGLGSDLKHLLAGLSCVPNTALAIYCPSLCITNIATQRIDQNVNRMMLEAMAYTGPDTTSELSMSAMRVAFG